MAVLTNLKHDKHMTNENRVIELLHAFNSPLSNAILWERIVRIAEITKADATASPSSYASPFCSPSDYIQWSEKVLEIAKQEEPAESVTCYLFMHDDAYQVYKAFTDDEEYLNLSDCINAMDEDGCCIYEIYEHHEYNKSHELLYKSSDYTNWVILSEKEVAELKKEGHIS